jgi:hypothetical protein
MAGSQIINDVIINYKSVGLDKVGGDIKQASVALDGLVVSATGSEKAIGSIENRFKSLERTLGTSGGNAQKFAKDQDLINKAVAQNPALQDRANEALAASAARYGIATKATEAHAASTKLARHEVINLGRQFQDIVVSLQGGQGLGTVLLQQGSQISDVFTSTSATAAGMKAQIGGLTTAIAALVTPAVAASAAIGTFATAGIAAAVNWSMAQTTVESALKGIGRQSGVTASDINGIAEATAKTTNATIGQAREFATAFAATGKIGKDNVEAATKATDALARSLGIDGAAAAKMFAAALADPAKGMGELEAATGAYDLKTQELVKSLVRQGEAEKARAVLIQATAAATKNAADQTGFWAARLKDLKDGFDLVGKDIVQGAELARSDLGGAGPTTGVSKQNQLQRAQGKQASFEQNLPAALAANAGDQQAVQAIYDAYGKLIDQVEKLKQSLAGDELAAFNARLKESASLADAAAAAFVPQIQKIRETEDAIAALTKAKQDDAISNSGANSQYYELALVAARNILKAQQESVPALAEQSNYIKQIGEDYKGVSTEAGVQLDAMEDQLKVLKARSASEKESAQYAKDYKDAIRSGKTETDAAAIAAGKAALNMERTRDNTRDARDAAIEWQRAMLNGTDAASMAAAASREVAEAWENAARAAAKGSFGTTSAGLGFGNVSGETYTSGGGSLEGMGEVEMAQAIDAAGVSGLGGGGARRIGVQPEQLWLLEQSNKINEDQAKARDDIIAAETAIFNGLNKSIDKLSGSTDKLNSTMQEALSPYYTQDPRLSKIGFRSQGMADGGYVTVPGGVSANDNMVATVPVASGERIYVDPMPTVRGRGGGGTTVTINMPITIQGNANKDEVGRTMYQASQSMARQLRAAGQ